MTAMGHKALQPESCRSCDFSLAKDNVGTAMYWVTSISNPIYKIPFSLAGLRP